MASQNHPKAEISLGNVSPPKFRAGLAFLNLLNLSVSICKFLGLGLGFFWGGWGVRLFVCFFLVVGFLVGLFSLRKYYYSVISCKSKGLSELEVGYRRSRIRPLVLRDSSLCAVGCLVS